MAKKYGTFEDIVRDFIPLEALPEVVRLWNEHPYILMVTRKRKTKKGDFRPDMMGSNHRISVNGTLNPYEFLLVLMHEYAHLMVWIKHQRNAKSHGNEWKHEFRQCMLPFTEIVDFSPHLRDAIVNYLIDPKAASGVDTGLQKELAKYNPPSDQIYIENLENGTLFHFDNRLFRMEKKLRKRFLCEEINTNRKYRFSPLAEVTIVEDFQKN